jgi:hypothetical protein
LHPDERLRRIAFAALIAQAELLPGWNDERVHFYRPTIFDGGGFRRARRLQQRKHLLRWLLVKNLD